MGICLSCIRPTEEEDPNSEIQPLLQSEQALAQKQQDLIEREEAYRSLRINQLEKIINHTTDVLIDSNNLLLDQSYSSINNGNLPRVVNKISGEEQLKGTTAAGSEEDIKGKLPNFKNDAGPLYVDIDQALTNSQ